MHQRKRIYYSETQKSLMWDRWQRGESLQKIAGLFDRHHSAVAGVLIRSGGIRPATRRRSLRALRSDERADAVPVANCERGRCRKVEGTRSRRGRGARVARYARHRSGRFVSIASPKTVVRDRQIWVGKRPLTKPCDRQNDAWKSTVADRPIGVSRRLHRDAAKLPLAELTTRR
jgi:hypothetical protein